MRLPLSLAFAVGLAAAQVFHGVAVAPNGQDAWAVTIESTGVYHTPDFGTNWAGQEIPTVRDFFDVFFLDEVKGWTCGRVADIWATSDGGQNWTRQNLGGPKFATRIQFLDEQNGWAAGGAAIILKTTNGGTDWNMVFFNNPPYPSDTVDFYGLAFSSADTGWLVAGRFPEGGDTFAFGQGFITKTTDNCANWTLQLKDTVYDFFDVKCASSQEAWVVGGNDRTMNAVVLHTSDGGTSWQEQMVPTESRLLRGLEFIGNHGWACGRNGTIIHTSDKGQTWQSQVSNVDTTLFDIDFADTLRGMVAGNSVVLVTIDGGNTWFRGLGAVGETPFPQEPARSGLAVEQSPALGEVRFQLAGAGLGELALYDAAGNLVRSLTVSGSSVVWDGRDEAGQVMSSGLYLAQLRRSGQTHTARFVLLAH